MRPIMQGFLQEIVKTGGFLGTAGKLIAKHPIAALTLAGTAATAGTAAASGYKGGLEGGEAGKYLAADKRGPSEAFYTNYHPLFEHRLSPAGERRLSWNYNPKSFKG